MIPLNYHHLYYFYVVARSGSIAKAREVLFLSQPTISAQIRELEEQLGHRLFDRRRQRLHLTEDGRLVLDYAERIFDLGGELSDLMGDRPVRAAPRVQIGVIAGFPAAICEALAIFLMREFPGARLVITMKETSVLTAELRDHRLDLVVSEAPLADEPGAELSSRLAARVPVVLAAAPRIARRLAGGAKSLAGFPVVIPASPWQLRHQLLQAFEHRGVKPEVIAETQDLELAWRLGIAGRCVVPVDLRTLAGLKGVMVRAPLRRVPPLHLPVYLTARQRRWPNPMAERALKGFRL